MSGHTLNWPDYMNHYRYFGFVAKAYISIKKPRDSSAITDVVEFVEKHKDDKTSRIILSGVIEALGVDSPENVRQPVQSYALREWQDPRIAGGGRPMAWFCPKKPSGYVRNG